MLSFIRNHSARLAVLAAAVGTLGLASAPAASADTLASIKERGYLQCGVNTGLAGFATRDDDGNYVGFDVDYCRALAAAIFGDAGSVRFTPLTAKERLVALQSGEIDVLSRNTTWTFTRDVNLGLDFIGVNYYDGQGFVVPNALGVESAKQLDGARICVQAGTTTELNLADYFRANGMSFESVVISTADEARQNYLAEACDAYTTDISGLAAVRSTFPDPTAHTILPEVISKEPLGPLVRQGDDQWADIARWTLNAMILAEELGVSSENVDELRTSSTNPEVRRLLGVEGDFGQQLSLGNDWAYNAIKQVGNYGESFARNVGSGTRMNLDRGLNKQWTEGGLMYAPPMR